MDGQFYYHNEDNNTNCPNISHENLIKEFQGVRIFGIISTLLLLATLILQLFFIYRYKSTFLHRQFLYTTVVVILVGIINILYLSSFSCLTFFLAIYGLNRYLLYVEILQITTIHLLLLYKLCKHIETRTMQRLQTLCCNIRPRLWHDVMIVCIQFCLPLPVLIVDIVVIQKIHSILDYFIVYLKHVQEEIYSILIPVLLASIILDLICIVVLVVWVYKLWKRRLLKSKARLVCTQISHIFFVLVVFLIGNILFLFSGYEYGLAVVFAIRTVAPISFGVYILISIPSLKRKVTMKAQVPATNRHTNPPSTRVSLPTDTAEHAPNFLSPSTAEPSEVTLLVND